MFEPIESLQARLARKDFLVGTFIQDVRSPFIIQLAASAGMDFVFLDGEHGSWSEETLSDLIKMARAVGVLPLVRVLAPEYTHLCPRLDAGAQGLLIPRIQNAGEVEHAVSCGRYPPEGLRGAITLKGHSDYAPIDAASFMKQHNETPVIIPQIETLEAVKNLDAILDEDGVAAVVVGPNDLSIAHGMPGKRQDPGMTGIIDGILKQAIERDVPCAIAVGDINAALEWRDKGMRILSVGADCTLLQASFTGIVNGLR